jgi:hypothetical protein
MKRLLGLRAGFAVLALAMVTTAIVVAQGQREGTPAAAGQGRGQGQGRGRGAPPPPPEPQAGHPSGKLVIWGDIANFDQPATAPTHCIITNRFQRGHRVGFRMTAFDGGTGETENTAVMTVHVTFGGRTVDVPMRWRGTFRFQLRSTRAIRPRCGRGCGRSRRCADRYRELHGHRVDRFNRMATFSPFPNTVSQLAVVE